MQAKNHSPLSLTLMFVMNKSGTSNFFLFILLGTSTNLFLRINRVHYAYNRSEFSMNSSVIAVFFQNNYNKYLEDYYLYAEALKHNLTYSDEDLEEYKKSIPIFWDYSTYKYSDTLFTSIKNNNKLSDMDIRNAICVMYMSGLMRMILKNDSLNIKLANTIQPIQWAGKIVNLSRAVTHRKIDNEDFDRFFTRSAEESKTLLFTGEDRVSGVFYKIPGIIPLEKIQLDTIRTHSNPKKLLQGFSKNITMQRFENVQPATDKIVFQLMSDKAFHYEGDTYVGFIENEVINVNMERMHNKRLQLYEGFLQHQDDHIRATLLLQQLNNKQISLNMFLKNNGAVDEIQSTGLIKKPYTLQHFPLTHKVHTNSVLFVDSQTSSPCIFIPTKKLLDKSIKTDWQNIGVNKEKEELNMLKITLSIYCGGDRAIIDTICNTKPSKHNLLKLIQILSSSTNLKKIPSVAEKEKVQKIFLSMIMTYWNLLNKPYNRFIDTLISTNANIWYKKTINENNY